MGYYVTAGELQDDLALDLLDHPNADVRRWTVRLLCDDRQVTSSVARKLAARSHKEPDLEVRIQMACSAKRIPATTALPVVRGLLEHSSDTQDPAPCVSERLVFLRQTR